MQEVAHPDDALLLCGRRRCRPTIGQHGQRVAVDEKLEGSDRGPKVRLSTVSRPISEGVSKASPDVPVLSEDARTTNAASQHRMSSRLPRLIR